MVTMYEKKGETIDFEKIADEFPGKKAKTIKKFYHEKIEN